MCTGERQILILTVLLDDKRRSPNLMRESGQEEAITKNRRVRNERLKIAFVIWY
jgi:hypothetical protein